MRYVLEASVAVASRRSNEPGHPDARRRCMPLFAGTHSPDRTPDRRLTFAESPSCAGEAQRRNRDDERQRSDEGDTMDARGGASGAGGMAGERSATGGLRAPARRGRAAAALWRKQLGMEVGGPSNPRVRSRLVPVTVTVRAAAEGSVAAPLVLVVEERRPSGDPGGVVTTTAAWVGELLATLRGPRA